jgi:hypothetical protein
VWNGVLATLLPEAGAALRDAGAFIRAAFSEPTLPAE